MVPLLSAALGGVTGTAFYFNGSHSRNLSIAELTTINCIQYTSCYPKSIKISGAKGGLIKCESDIFSIHPQTRTVVGSFPSATVPNLPLNFHEMGGTNGYFRIGDQVNALASTDDIQITDFNIDVVTGFDELYANESDLATPQALGPMIPVWGMVQPSVKFNFKIPKFTAETFLTFQDNDTALQAELYLYKSATQTLKIQFSNFKIKPELTSEDLTGLNIECMIGRNGIGTSYVNSNMAFTSPIYVTIVNA